MVDMDIARSRDIPTRDILRHELTDDNILFDSMYLQKPDKASLAAALEQVLQSNDYNFDQSDVMDTVTVVDFMSTIKKIPLANLSNIRSYSDSLWGLIKHSVQQPTHCL